MTGKMYTLLTVCLLLCFSIGWIAYDTAHAPKADAPQEQIKPAPRMLTQEQVAQLFAQADAFHNDGEYQKAIDIFKEVLADNPDMIEAYMKIAHTYRYWYKYAQSEEWFLKAIAKSPPNAHIYTDLGKLYRNMGEYDKAEAAFLKSISLDPNLAEIYNYGLGYLYLEQDRYLEAETMMLKGLELDPTNSFSYMSLGDLYREMEKFELSEQMFKKALEIDPKSESYFGLGLLYEHQKRYDEAAATYLLYIERIREKAEVYNALARVYEAQGRYDSALQTVEKALSLNPGNEIFITHKQAIEYKVSASN
jgi:tetratricopeptide (TPR) repeat protein